MRVNGIACGHAVDRECRRHRYCLTMYAAFRATIHGRVQGVGFRWFVAREARRLDLRGFVRNLADGSVEVVAGGDPIALAALLAVVRQGPPASHVERVERDDLDPPPALGDFDIQA